VRNIEVKARLEHPQAVHERLRAHAACFITTLHQRDVFFAVPVGRLKLRFVAATVAGARNDSTDSAELIFYQRADTPELRGSDYERVAIADGMALWRSLKAALGVIGEVRKVRQLYTLENVRIHLDTVEGLGDYLEIEAVLDDDHDEAQCRAAAQALLEVLQITPAAYESRAYIELSRERAQSTR
jgi:predicted adenylyl cyclase CyaB